MYVIPYPAKPIRWTTRCPGTPHRLPAHRLPIPVPPLPPEQPAPRGLIVAGPLLVSLAVALIAALSWLVTR